MGWEKEICKASICIDSNEPIHEQKESDILRKVKKLLALGASSHHHEAEAAMIKSRELLLKHHIDTPVLESSEEETIVLKRILPQRIQNAKLHTIAKILETFFLFL